MSTLPTQLTIASSESTKIFCTAISLDNDVDADADVVIVVVIVITEILSHTTREISCLLCTMLELNHLTWAKLTFKLDSIRCQMISMIGNFN